MSWADFHARTDILHTVLDRVARSRLPLNPADPTLFEGLPELERLFGGVDGVLLALRARWQNHLDVKLEHALAQGKSVPQVVHELTAEQPALRAILDAFDTDRLYYRRPRARALAG
ncbi:hypothetical protein D7D52_08705 [Nocardia yunnanensis]|uniref:Uncharacterized protein n=1 Tax=Nocardia yunnanensis TaxID=2382165 RepID=A0A386Z8F8_9NOCA|nr:hypothetical protein [Nocardia yunnanensis]AYF73930.1 hypothetical protein D7D52_08705 [Nocardia yunnanensis]